MHCDVERGEELVPGLELVPSRQGLDQTRLAAVGVAHNGDAGDAKLE